AGGVVLVPIVIAHTASISDRTSIAAYARSFSMWIHEDRLARSPPHEAVADPENRQRRGRAECSTRLGKRVARPGLGRVRAGELAVGESACHQRDRPYAHRGARVHAGDRELLDHAE